MLVELDYQGIRGYSFDVRASMRPPLAHGFVLIRSEFGVNVARFLLSLCEESGPKGLASPSRLELLAVSPSHGPIVLVFEYGPTRHCYKNETRVFSLPLVQPCAAVFLPTGIEASAQESSEMKAQADGTNRASRNSMLGIAQARKGSTMLRATIVIWILLLLLALNLMAFVTRITEKRRPNKPFVESVKNHTKS